MSNSPDNKPDVEAVRASGARPMIGQLWTPVVGDQLRVMLQGKSDLPQQERELAERQAISILGKCISPNESAKRETGLAVGYVQSGKTLSFTCVAALASDNRYPLVIVITGTSKPLYRQSVRRLRTDLRIDAPASHAWSWQFFENPNLRLNHQEGIKATLAEWREPKIPDKQTCLIAVMKNWRHLGHLVDLLQTLDLQGVPAIVIDDEADQAGLNTMVNQNDQSRTYKSLLALRDSLPHHTYIQYTATPQAPLLINMIDVLSPRFVEVLEPGRDYVGVIDFFQHNRALVKTIPANEIPSQGNQIVGAPESLREALRLFFIGVAAGLKKAQGQNRSMLVHPSRLQDKHADYKSWVSSIRADWLRLLNEVGDPDRAALINDFRDSYAALSTTHTDLPTFDAIEAVLWQTINRTQVCEVNARLGKTPEVDWQSRYANILVGGQAMDRGFTVEGLTITYMPRERGVGNADTIQQRARFLGYKRSYLGLCRVFLEQDVRRDYTVYVEHEENLRDQLRQHAAAGRSLADWRRAFFLDSTLRPTRRNVLDLDYKNMNFAAEWFNPKAPHFGNVTSEYNRKCIAAFIDRLSFVDSNGHTSRTEMHRHGYAKVKLSELYVELLSNIQFAHPTDSQQFTGLLLQLKEYLDSNPVAVAHIYLMSWTCERGQVVRERTLDENSEISTSGAFFQGASVESKDFSRGEVYPGDREIKGENELTVQLHLLNLLEQGGQRKVAAEKVWAIAVWMPTEMGIDTLVQDKAT